MKIHYFTIILCFLVSSFLLNSCFITNRNNQQDEYQYGNSILGQIITNYKMAEDAILEESRNAASKEYIKKNKGEIKFLNVNERIDSNGLSLKISGPYDAILEKGNPVYNIINLFIDEYKIYSLKYYIEKHIDYYNLKKVKHLVSRNDSSLFLKLKNGSVKVLRNTKFGDGIRGYLYKKFYPQYGFFLIEVHKYEGGLYLLINDTTGEEFRINGIPEFSPDGQLMMTTPYDMGTYFNEPALIIWKVANSKIRRLLTWNKENANIKRAEWIDSKTIQFEMGSIHALYNDCDSGMVSPMVIIPRKCTRIYKIEIL